MRDGGRRLVLAGLLLAGALIGWQQLRLGPGLLETRLASSARQALAQEEPGRAAADGVALLRVAPLSAVTGNVLAEVALARNDPDGAAALYALSAGRDLRDLASHAWLADHHGRHGRYREAMEHLGLLLDVHPALRGEVFPALVGFMAGPDGMEAILELLRDAPAWRRAFLVQAARELERVDPLLELHTRLRTGERPLTQAELAPVVDRMVRDGEARRAWVLFAASLPEDALPLLGNVFNASFEAEPGGMVFDWRFGRVPGALIERVQELDDQGQSITALRVEFLNRRVPFRHVSQLLVLEPGEYRLHGRVRLESLRSGPGLEWVVQCAEGGRGIAGRSERFRGTRAWSAFEARVEVPPDCRAQWLRLQLPARVDSEQQIVGRLWFDGVRISRLQGP